MLKLRKIPIGTNCKEVHIRPRLVVVVITIMAVLFLWSAPVLAATQQSYNIVVPRFGGDAWSSTKTVNPYKDFGVKHQYSGGWKINFTVCDTTGNPLGPTIGVNPGGSSAPLVDLWYNGSSSSKTIKVLLETLWYCPVDVLAQGLWYWNY